MSDLQALAPAITLLMLGAMTPGPSLAVVIRNTLAGGRWQGVQCAIGHGLGFGVYALGVVMGLVVLMRQAPMTFNLIQALSAGLLVYMGIQALRAPADDFSPAQSADRRRSVRGFVEGLLIAIVNPKIALFFAAVFSSVLNDQLTRTTQLAMALSGWIIDTSWYVLVALLLTSGPALGLLQRNARRLNVSMGILFIGLAVVTVYRLMRSMNA